MRFRIISLGCPKNLVESEYIADSLERAGHVLTDDCDTVVINTCAFIADAAKESIETILEETGRGSRKVIVIGCLVERYGEKLQGLLPEVDLFIGRNWYDEIAALSDKKGLFARAGAFAETFPRRVLTSKPTAYLKIQEGCDNRCSYCTVPDIRGGLRSRGPEDIKREFEWLIGNGYREINIIGQDITSYGRHGGTTLRLLLQDLLATEGDYLLRLLYMHPKGIDDDLIDCIACSDKIIPYMDIPIQHSEDRILGLMGRGCTKDDLAALFGKIRKKIPDAVLRTTVIVGFPGETEGEFQGLMDFIGRHEFDMLGAFMYSREEGTPAYRLPGHVRKGVKQARYNAVMGLQKEISRRRLKRLEGKTMKVIVEGKEEASMVGRLIIQAPDIDGIAFIRGDCAIGEMRNGKIVKTLDYDVIVEM
ncbi:MAG: Ribosomal protein S12 methylthiotransferase RimO [Syntrophorhabdus sp. PtaU1.Bin058]|nr:MAG: Ribosomal protein S12 methylthiotransferase RimO [Syntrophorhabdus sp. PtaU1.Bin058]